MVLKRLSFAHLIASATVQKSVEHIFVCLFLGFPFSTDLCIALSVNVTQSGLLQPCRRTYCWALGSVILFQDYFSCYLSLCGLLLQNNTDLVS